ncbi:MAG TPA: beta-ketoacyl synthase N-terminal-like domain-containing protein [Polyangiaceae bacterium]
MAVAIVARGAASALGLGPAAFAVGEAHETARMAWSTRASGKPFARVTASAAGRVERPRALLELGLQQVVEQLTADDPAWRARRLGLVIGSSSGGLAALERQLGPAAGEPSAEGGWARCSYFAPLQGLSGVLGKSPERLVSLYAACASSALALGLGLRWLELGRCELVIAGGYDAESDWVGAGFDSLKATSAAPPRSFRADRDGMALGEGVALVALTRAAARAYGYIVGFGASSDAVHITAPDRSGRGLARAAQQALCDAALPARAVDFVSVHGTGTSYNDASEARALGLVFGERASELPLHAFKPAVGHTLGAASALEALAALDALERGLLPASAGSGAPMPGLPSTLLERNQPAAAKYCLKLATAFGGANAALVLGRGRDAQPARTLAARPVHLVAAGAAVHQLELERVLPELVCAVERLPRSDLLSELAIAAGADLLAQARARGVSLERARTGVVVGSVGATLEADAEFGVRILARGPEHAEPRRFPATSPNACAGHVAIAFGLGGLAHAVGSGAGAALEAFEVACDWLAAGDVDAVLVLAAEHVGPTSARVLAASGIPALEQGARGLLLAVAPGGPRVDAELLARLPGGRDSLENLGFRAFEAVCQAAGLPGSAAFGSVRRPE